MGNLFQGIALSQNFREDLATDALHYMLQRTPDPVRTKLRAGFASLWSSIPGLSLNIDRYETRIWGDASGGCPDLTGYPMPDNWLRVSGATKMPQVDKRICHQLHAIVPLLDELEPQQQPFEFILPREGPLHA
jgi:hypothetical protein